MHSRAGVTRPMQGPNPIDTKPPRSHRPKNAISSPSSINSRVSPFGSVIGSLPTVESSKKLARSALVGPDIVPVPMRSPGTSRQPVMECCASICAGVQRSEEHTSELQSLMRISYAVFCLKTQNKHHIIRYVTHKSYMVASI